MNESAMTRTLLARIRQAEPDAFVWKITEAIAGGKPDALYIGRAKTTWIEFKKCVGKTPNPIAQLTELQKENDVNVAQDTSGYAVRNVHERLKHYYKDDFELTYDSKPGQGTRVQLVIPAVLSMGGSDEHVSAAYRG